MPIQLGVEVGVAVGVGKHGSGATPTPFLEVAGMFMLWSPFMCFPPLIQDTSFFLPVVF